MKINEVENIGKSAFLFRSALTEQAQNLLEEVNRISNFSPFRKMTTRRGIMSVEMTNCGEIGWLSDKRGYRYTKIDPITQKKWPDMPDWIKLLATKAAEYCDFHGFYPNACLINKYTLGTRLSLHIDNDEGDIESPIISFNLGLPAIFRWGGLSPKDAIKNLLINHGDVLMWGGVDRLRYHGISKICNGSVGNGINERFVMTFRHAKIWHYN